METAHHCEKCMRSVVLLCRKITKNIYSWTNLSLLAPSEIIFILTHFYFLQLLCSFLIKCISVMIQPHSSSHIALCVLCWHWSPQTGHNLGLANTLNFKGVSLCKHNLHLLFSHFCTVFFFSLIPLSIDSLNATVVFYTWWLLHLDVIYGASANCWSFAFN